MSEVKKERSNTDVVRELYINSMILNDRYVKQEISLSNNANYGYIPTGKVEKLIVKAILERFPL